MHGRLQMVQGLGDPLQTIHQRIEEPSRGAWTLYYDCEWATPYLLGPRWCETTHWHHSSYSDRRSKLYEFQGHTRIYSWTRCTLLSIVTLTSMHFFRHKAGMLARIGLSAHHYVLKAVPDAQNDVDPPQLQFDVTLESLLLQFHFLHKDARCLLVR